MKAAISKCQIMLHYYNHKSYLGRRQKPSGGFQIVVRKKGQVKNTVGVGLLTTVHKVG